MSIDFPTLATPTLAQVSTDLKAEVLRRIAAHFAQHPAPIDKPDPQQPAELLQLLPYHVQTTEESTAFIVRLRATDFDYEDHNGSLSQEGYDVLHVEELLDIVQVLESAAG